MNRPRRALLPVLGLWLLFAPSALAAMPAAIVRWEAGAARASRSSLLLVLERGAEGWSLLDARTATVAAKVRRARGPVPGPVFALLDADGTALLAGSLEIGGSLHGPVLDESGELRCVSVPPAGLTVAVRVPMPVGAADFALYEAAEFAPTSGPELAAALSAKATDAGLTELARFDLRPLSGPAP